MWGLIKIKSWIFDPPSHPDDLKESNFNWKGLDKLADYGLWYEWEVIMKTLNVDDSFNKFS